MDHDVCSICMDADGTLFTGYHNQCVFTVHRECFSRWYEYNRICIICREPVLDVSRSAIAVGAIVFSLTIIAYGLVFLLLMNERVKLNRYDT